MGLMPRSQNFHMCASIFPVLFPVNNLSSVAFSDILQSCVDLIVGCPKLQKYISHGNATCRKESVFVILQSNGVTCIETSLNLCNIPYAATRILCHNCWRDL